MFAANSPLRKKIILKPEEKKGLAFDGEGKKRPNKEWSLMLARVFKIRPLGSIKEPEQIRRYLKHADLEYEAPPRVEQDSLEFDQTLLDQDNEAVIYLD